jgi:hypothetical protein
MAQASPRDNMNTRQIKILAIALIILLLGFFATKLSNDQSGGGTLLFPDLKGSINDVSELTVVKAGELIRITSESGQWTLPDRDNYPADTGKLRKLLLALADAKKIEEKTSKPELYGQLGVEDSSADSQGTEIRIGGAELDLSVIIGNLAQRKYRYARIPGEQRSWLIDQNPTIPADVSGWLMNEILDIDRDLVQSVTITHSDGETIRIEKDHRAATNFSVPDIPDGRELSYPSVVDGIAGVLAGLNLQDVARASEAADDETAVGTVYTTFDGLTITIDSVEVDDETWITVSAAQSEPEPGPESDSEQQKPASDAPSAADINARLGGWSYRIQSYKADQLRRRWEDILKAEE